MFKVQKHCREKAKSKKELHEIHWLSFKVAKSWMNCQLFKSEERMEKKAFSLLMYCSPISHFCFSPLTYLLPQVRFFLYDVIDMSMENNTWQKSWPIRPISRCLSFALSFPCSLFSPMKGKGFPSCLYMVRVVRSCSAVWQECVCLWDLTGNVQLAQSPHRSPWQVQVWFV